jgi:hypothetical protein
LHLVRRGLFDGSARLDLHGLTQTRLVVVDVDVHGVCPTARVRGIRETLPQVWRRNAAHTRKWRAECAQRVVDELQAEVRATLVERTARGFHLVWKLAVSIPVAVAASIALELVARVEKSPEIELEAFPKLTADGTGRLCALPLLGTHREVTRDLVMNAFARLRTPIELFLAAPGVALEDFGVSEAPVRDDETPLVSDMTAANTCTSEKLPAPTSNVLHGKAFALEVRRLLTEGLAYGAHYDEGRRLAFGLFTVSPNVEVARRRFEAILELPIHGSRHAKNDRRHLLREFDAYARRFVRGASAGYFYFDGMRSEWIRAFVAELDVRRAIAA